MSVDILTEIKKAEADADQIVKKSIADARQIVVNAERQSQIFIEDTVVELDNKSKDILSNAEAEAAALIADIKKNVLNECNELKKKSGEKLDMAADYIVGRIVNIHVNS